MLEINRGKKNVNFKLKWLHHSFKLAKTARKKEKGNSKAAGKRE